MMIHDIWFYTISSSIFLLWFRLPYEVDVDFIFIGKTVETSVDVRIAAIAMTEKLYDRLWIVGRCMNKYCT